jgi:hypothetical protein
MTATAYDATPARARSFVRERGDGASDASRGGGGRSAQRSGAASLPVRVPLGRLLVTPGALAALERAGAEPAAYLARHAGCDWGDLDPEDRQANDRALVDGERLLSAYRLADGVRIWIVTDADRGSTTVLTPDEY